MRETVCGVFLTQMDIPIQMWHMVEVIRRDFNEHHITQVPMTENQLGEMKMMDEVAEHVGLNYPTILTVDMWLNQSTISSFLERRDLWRNILPSKRMSGSIKTNNGDEGKTSFALHLELAKL